MPRAPQPLRHAADAARRPGLLRVAPAPDHHRPPQCGIATAVQVDIAHASSGAILAMVHELGGNRLQATVLNFAAREVVATVT